MSNEHRVIESNILSGNKIGSHNVIIVAAIPVIAISAVLVLAVIPHLAEIWLMIEALTFTIVACLMVLAIIAVVYVGYRFRIKAQHEERQSRFFQWTDGAAWINDAGEIIHLSAEHEQAKLPAPRVEVTEVAELSPEDKEVVERSKVLNMREDGATLEEIRDALGIPYNRVQRYCKAAVNLEIKKRR